MKFPHKRFVISSDDVLVLKSNTPRPMMISSLAHICFTRTQWVKAEWRICLRLWTTSSLVLIMADRRFSTKPLSAPLLAYYRNWPRRGLRWSGLCCHSRHSRPSKKLCYGTRGNNQYRDLQAEVYFEVTRFCIARDERQYRKCSGYGQLPVRCQAIT